MRFGPPLCPGAVIPCRALCSPAGAAIPSWCLGCGLALDPGCRFSGSPSPLLCWGWGVRGPAEPLGSPGSRTRTLSLRAGPRAIAFVCSQADGLGGAQRRLGHMDWVATLLSRASGPSRARPASARVLDSADDGPPARLGGSLDPRPLRDQGPSPALGAENLLLKRSRAVVMGGGRPVSSPPEVRFPPWEPAPASGLGG